MGFLRMTKQSENVPGCATKLYSDRVTTNFTSADYLVPDGKIESIWGAVATTTGATGTIVQTTEGTAGTKEVQTLSITAGTNISGYVVVKLDGTDFPIAVGANLSDTLLASAIRAADFGSDWVVTGTDADVIFTADAVGARAGAYAFTVSGTGAIQLSYSPIQEIASGNGIFTAWNGSSAISPSLTAWRVVPSAGYITGEMSIRTTLGGEKPY